jgi:hypothetical protein
LTRHPPLQSDALPISNAVSDVNIITRTVSSCFMVYVLFLVFILRLKYSLLMSTFIK